MVLGDNGTARFDDQQAPTRFETIAPLDGGFDALDAGPEHDFVFGGTGGDTIFGGSEHDVLLGDHGLYDVTFPANQRFRSIFTYNEHAGGLDTIHGDEGDDMILGQQGADYLYGDQGEDDITGGHNYLTESISGHDAGDYIEGGSGSDVIIGDNGILERTVLTLDPWTWKRYPDTQNTEAIKLDDVKRIVTRYDNQEALRFHDATLMHGNDTIYGDQPNTSLNLADGHDIAFGQRGDDIMHGGGGDDELIGENGADTIHGGHGHDVVLGDNGEILRDYTDPDNPRVNTTGMWHRDIILADHATLVDVANPRSAPSAAEARKLVEADLLLAAGTYDATDSPKQINNVWESHVLLLDLHSADDDILQGGAGDDTILGQRGNDIIDGNAGNDYLVGDKASHQASSAQQLPFIFDGLLVFGGASKQFQLSDSGTYVLPPIQLNPEEMDLNQLYRTSRGHGNVQSREADEVLDFMQGGILLHTSPDGARTGYLPVLSMIPRIMGHEHVLPGNDRISGGTGSDWIIGDTSRLESQLVSGIPAIDDAVYQLSTELRLATHTMHYLALDAATAFPTANTDDVEFGNDDLMGSIDLLPDTEDPFTADPLPGALDNIVGDDQHTITAVHRGLPTENNAVPLAQKLLDYLHATRIAAADLEALLYSAHRSILSSLPTTGPHAATNLPIIGFGNDSVGSEPGGPIDTEASFVTGDSALRLHYLVEGTELTHGNSLVQLPPADLSSIAAHQDQLESQYRDHIRTQPLLKQNAAAPSLLRAIPNDREHHLEIGNDLIAGSDSNDLLIGDFSTYALPIVNQCTLNRILSKQDAACADKHSLIDRETLNDLSHPDRLRLTGAIEASLIEMRKYIDRSAHDLSFDLLEEHYTESSKDQDPLYRHPFYGHRSDAAPVSTIAAGNDRLNALAGDDVILGDSESFYTEMVATTDGLTQLALTELGTDNTTFTYQLDSKFHTNYQHRDRFELTDRLVPTTKSTWESGGSVGGIDNDILAGGTGNDILLGQQNQDYLMVDDGEDTRYGGSGVDKIPAEDCIRESNPFCDDPNNVMLDGPNRPDHQELESLKTRVLSSSTRLQPSSPWTSAIVADTLNDPFYRAERDFTTTQTGTGWITSDESFTADAYRMQTNPINAEDVTGDAAVTPRDALLIINRLNRPFAYSAVYGGMGVLAKQYLDVNADGILTPLDVLLVINVLNSQTELAEGEPGQLPATMVTAVPSRPATGTSRTETAIPLPVQGENYRSPQAVADRGSRDPEIPAETRYSGARSALREAEEMDLLFWSEPSWIPGELPVPPGCQL